MNASTSRKSLPRASAPSCAHCGRPLHRPGVVIPGLGVVGPECRHKHAALLAMEADVQARVFNLDDQGDLRAAHLFYSAAYHAGWDVQKVPDLHARTMRVMITGRRKLGTAIVEGWEQRRARFERDLQVGGVAA